MKSHDPASRPRRFVRGTLSLATIVGTVCLAGVAAGAEVASDRVPLRQFPLGQVFTLLFLMLGPFKIIGPFLKITQGADDRLAHRIALWATAFAALALLLAGFLGEKFLSSYGVPLPVLALAGGIILFLVALKNVLEQFEPSEPPPGVAAVAPEAAMKVALRPLAFPSIVTPYGIAALVVFLAFSQTLESRLTIGAVVVAIMVLNLIVMLVARRLQTVVSLMLPILGAVLGVVQVALGLQIINNALRTLGSL
jgi:multiple antibiotic resistance protein